jgi:5'-3' exoribonuclease 2
VAYDRVRSDIVGPVNVSSVSGARYIITFVDDFSRESSVFFLKEKSDAADAFETYLNTVVYPQKHRLNILRSDNGTEYTSRAFQDVLQRHHIAPEKSPPYLPASNGTAVRFNRTILSRARATLADSGLSAAFWAEAVRTATYL